MVTATMASPMVTTTLAAAVITATLTVAVIAAALTIAVIAAALAVTMTGTSATTTAPFGTAASGKLSACSGISLHIVGIVTQLADLLAQLVGTGFLRVVDDGQFRRLHVVRV